MVVEYSTPDVERECGNRIEGGLYCELTQGRGGAPIEEFLIDLPYPVDVRTLGIGAQGVTVIERDGVWNIWDRVGKASYPRVDMFIEEARRYGVSRRIPKNTANLDKVDPDRSRYILIHEYAGISEPGAYVRPVYDDRRSQPYCPTEQVAHVDQVGTTRCIGLCWEDHETGGRVTINTEGYRPVTVTMKTFTYQAALAPEKGLTHFHAAFMSFPASRFVAVKGGSDKDGDALEKLRAKHTIYEVDR